MTTTSVRLTPTLLSAICLVYITLLSVIQLSLLGEPARPDAPRPSIGVSGGGGDLTQGSASKDRYINTDNSNEERGTGQVPALPKSADRSGFIVNNLRGLQGEAEKEGFNSDGARNNGGMSQDSVLLRKLSENKRQSGESTPPPTESQAGQNQMSPNEPQSFASASDFIETSVKFTPLSDLYVYATYLDARRAPEIYVRILALRPSGNDTPALVCRFQGGERPLSVAAREYEMCENHGKKYGGWIYSCLLPAVLHGTLPTTVTIATVSDTGQTYDVINFVHLRSLSPVNNTAVELEHSNKTQNSSASHKNDAQQQRPVPTEKYPHTQLQSPMQTQRSTFQSKHTNISSSSKSFNSSIGVCVPPLYGDISLERIVNFLEMCKILGARRVFLYIHNLPKDLVIFLRHYAVQHGGHFLSLVQWELPVLSDDWLDQPQTLSNQILWNRGQLLAVQHCLYQNMASFDWLLFMDTDEMLVPQTVATWPDLVQQILDVQPKTSKSDSIAAISFQSAFFQQDFQTLVTNSIDYFQYLHRTRDTSKRRAKLLVRPRAAFEVGIHHLSKPIDDNFHSIEASPISSALLHHYRKCVTGSGREEKLQCEILVKDVAILKYEHALTVASRAVIHDAMVLFADQR